MQVPKHRAVERDEAAIATWRKEGVAGGKTVHRLDDLLPAAIARLAQPHAPDGRRVSQCPGILASMTPWTLGDIEKALCESWAADTCSPDDLARAGWQADNPAWGHCDITALLVNDLFGGDLVVGEVHLHGVQHGFHWWNRLASGTDIDLTRSQFRLGQIITTTRVVARPPGMPPRRFDEYRLLRERVSVRLGELPPPGGTPVGTPA